MCQKPNKIAAGQERGGRRDSSLESICRATGEEVPDFLKKYILAILNYFVPKQQNEEKPPYKQKNQIQSLQ